MRLTILTPTVRQTFCIVVRWMSFTPRVKALVQSDLPATFPRTDRALAGSAFTPMTLGAVALHLFDRRTAGPGVRSTDFRVESRSIDGPTPAGTDDNGVVLDRSETGPWADLSPYPCGLAFGSARHDDLDWAR
jgi:hypothetical protein